MPFATNAFAFITRSRGQGNLWFFITAASGPEPTGVIWLTWMH